MALKCSLCKKVKSKQKFKGDMLICQDCTVGKTTNHKDKLVQLIYMISDDLKIDTVDTDLGIIEISRNNQDAFKKKYTPKQLREIADTLIDLEDAMTDENSNREDSLIINPLEIIDKYNEGALNIASERENENEQWRNHIPKQIKINMKNWRTASLNDIYDNSKLLMESSTGDLRNELFEYVCDLSELVFAEQDDIEETDYHLSDELATSIMSLVEMIILPHLEVLDRIKETGGNVKFVNMWNKNFTETLKQEVKDRDGWKCVICENDKGLHVHHKIPRKFGGVHHKSNLVTLCASCHGAIETANVQHAFKKCLSNFRKQKNKGSEIIYTGKDKTLLKEEVENALDKVLLSLTNKDEDELAKEITGIMERLEIIFYE